MQLFTNMTIMPSEIAQRLLMVKNGKPVESISEHQGALYFRIKDLIEQAQEEEHEDVRALIEEYLNTEDFEDSPADYAHAILESQAFKSLWGDAQSAWLNVSPEDFGEEVFENSIASLAGGPGRAALIALYEDTDTLRKYLEQLSMYAE